MRNPFVFGGPVAPDDFYGRRNTVAFLLDRLYGRSRSSIALWGDRRVGKTSLLYYLAQPRLRQEWGADPARHHIIFIDCQIFAQFSRQAFWHEVLEQVTLLGSEASWCAEAESLLGAGNLSERPLRRLFYQMQAAGETLTLLLDEFSYITSGTEAGEEVKDWLAFLRTVITAVNPGSPHSRPLAVITSSRRPLDEVCRPIYGNRDAGSPFHNPFVFERLKPFGEEDVRALIQAKLQGTGIHFTEREMVQLLTVAGRHPILVQSYAGELFRAKVVSQQDVNDFGPIDRTFYDRNTPHFQDFWLYSGAAERRFLADYAKQNLDFKALTAEQESARRQLLDRGLLAEDNQLFSPLFRAWLRLSLPQIEAAQAGGQRLPNLSDLLDGLDAHFNEQELRDLSFELGLDYDNLAGDVKREKARELITFMQRRHRLPELRQAVERERPHLRW